MQQLTSEQHYDYKIHQVSQPSYQTSDYIDDNRKYTEEEAVAENNLLVYIASRLLTLMTQLRYTTEHQNVRKLRAQVVEEIKSFQIKAKNANYSPDLITAAQYCLCTAIDEAVLNRTWGVNSVWSQQSLLSLFHKETNGGHRFYILIEAFAQNFRQNIDFLELAYFLLSLGFEGQYFGKNEVIRDEIRNRLMYRIRQTRQKPEKVLTYHQEDNLTTLKKKSKKSKIKRLFLGSLVIVLALAAYFNIKVYRQANPVFTQLENIGTVSPVTSFSQVVERAVVND